MGELQKRPGFFVSQLANYNLRVDTSSNFPGTLKLVLATSISAKSRFHKFDFGWDRHKKMPSIPQLQFRNFSFGEGTKNKCPHM